MQNPTKNSRPKGNSLYLKISGLFLSILLLIGVAYFLITAYSAQRYYQETTQRLNSQVASHMLLEVNPFVNGVVNEQALGQIMHSMMAVNPGLEVYLLDPTGKILSFVVLDKKVKLDRVNIEPVLEFIQQDGQTYVLGDDPRNPGKSGVFSATAVEENGKLLGYVYMVLVSEQFENIASTLRNSYLLKTGGQLFVITLFAALSLGLLTIWWLTRNFRKIIQTVRRFEQGDLKARVPVKSNDELGELASTFNHMADTLLANIEQLKNVDNLRKELIANISHDLRTPLSVIHGFVETLSLKKDQLTDSEREEYLQIIMKSTVRLKKLVFDLFELSKLEARQVEPKLEKFAIADLVNDLTAKYRLLAQKQNIQLDAIIDDQGAMVMADLALMERVLQNLLDNALQNTPENGQVRLEVLRSSHGVEVSVQNTGEGIASADLEHIFDRYFKGNGASNKGSGLGLAIVKNILEIHNSMIHVSSKLKENTTFFFRLPLQPS